MLRPFRKLTGNIVTRRFCIRRFHFSSDPRPRDCTTEASPLSETSNFQHPASCRFHTPRTAPSITGNITAFSGRSYFPRRIHRNALDKGCVSIGETNELFLRFTGGIAGKVRGYPSIPSNSVWFLVIYSDNSESIRVVGRFYDRMQRGCINNVI